MPHSDFSERLEATAASMRKVGERMERTSQPPSFSHRNGETEPPTVAGIYFIQHPQSWYRKDSGVVSVEYDMDEDGFGAGWIAWSFGQDYYALVEKLDANIKWYGPIQAPWEHYV